MNSIPKEKKKVARAKLLAFNDLLCGWIDIGDGRPDIWLPYYPAHIMALCEPTIAGDKPSILRARFERVGRQGINFVYRLTELS